MARKTSKKTVAPSLADVSMMSAVIAEQTGHIPATVVEQLLAIDHDEKIDRQEREDLAMIHDEPEFDHNPNTDVSDDEIAEALASIVPEMETAAGADAIDHHSQSASWTPIEQTITDLEERDLNSAADFADGIEPELTLDNLRAAVSEHDAGVMVFKIKNEVDIREAYEIQKGDEKGTNLNILSTIKKVRTQMVTLRAAKLLCAINVDPGEMNREIHSGARYNVYALGKLSDVIYGVTDGVIRNAINIACMKSLFAFQKAGVPFTMETAKGACSKQYALKKLDAATRQHLISHLVAEGTASTQASSTMQALTTLGVVKPNGAGKNPSYVLTDTPITKKLRDLMAA